MILQLRLSVSFVCLLALQFCTTAQASVVIHQTRVIYPADESEVSVRLTNEGDGPKLIQAWIDDGRALAEPEMLDVPFQILTPLFRLDAQKGQVLRIIQLDNELPADRESIFWLSVLEAPPKPKPKQQAEEEQNYVQFSFRTRVKMFYRPKSLMGEGANKAPNELKWSLVAGRISVSNPTPYHVNIAGFSIGKEGGKEDERVEGVLDMLPPYSSGEVKFAGGMQVDSRIYPRVKFSAIDDYGAKREHEVRLD